MWGEETKRRQAWLAGGWKETETVLAGHRLYVGGDREPLQVFDQQVFDQQSDRIEPDSLDDNRAC